MTDDQRELDAILRNDLTSFIRKTFNIVSPGDNYIHGRHIDAIAYELGQCLNGKTKRLIITMPPRYLKSVCASVAFPAFVLGHDPSRRIISVCYSDDLTKKHARDFRLVTNSPEYRRLFPDTKFVSEALGELVTSENGSRYATSIGGTLRGRGGHMIIVDDPIKGAGVMSEAERFAVKDFYDTTLYSRLDDKKEGVIIIVTQRTHVDDLVGHVLDKEEWVHLNLPAIATENQAIPIGDDMIWMRRRGTALHPERESLKDLKRLSASMPEIVWQAQYQQDPVPPGGYLIKREFFPRYVVRLRRCDFSHVILSVDVAQSRRDGASYSVILVFGLSHDGKAYLWDCIRGRFRQSELKTEILRQHFRYRANFLIVERAPISYGLIDELTPNQQELGLITIAPASDKVARVTHALFTLESRKVVLPDEADWLADFEEEIFSFPHGRHDDQVDALSQFVLWWRADKVQRFWLRR